MMATAHNYTQVEIDAMMDDCLDECPHCGGEGLVWGCFEDTCVCVDDDGLGCSPSRCDYCRPIRKLEVRP